MTSGTPQTYANHRRLDPVFHQLAFGLWVLIFAFAVRHMIHAPGIGPAWEILVSLLLLVLALCARTYSLKNQDRIIRLEETLRLERVLSPGMRPRIAELSVGQMVSLRFASDEELPGLVEQTLAENLDRETIKKRIRTWRPDTHRV